jgi:hypothetical protein
MYYLISFAAGLVFAVVTIGLFYLLVRVCATLDVHPIWFCVGGAALLACLALVGLARNQLEAALWFKFHRPAGVVGYVVGVIVLGVGLYRQLRSA